MNILEIILIMYIVLSVELFLIVKIIDLLLFFLVNELLILEIKKSLVFFLVILRWIFGDVINFLVIDVDVLIL